MTINPKFMTQTYTAYILIPMYWWYVKIDVNVFKNL